ETARGIGCALSVAAGSGLFDFYDLDAHMLVGTEPTGGAFEQALQTLEQIGPRSSTFVPLPQHIYHLYRAEVFVQARNFVKAENELNFAQNNEADSGRIAVLRSMIHRLKGEYAAAEQELESAISTTRQASVLFFEAAMLNFDLGNNPWEAKRMFREVLEKPEMPHYAGETTHQLAKAYWNACRLKTGEAEEGLEQLSWFIERFRSAVAYIDTLRPYLSRLLLERSAYFAGHGDPAAALVDLRTAIVFCAYPSVLDKAEVIKDELEWRYKLPLVW
ncbi:MAG TPA: hypothetical protein PLP17_16515, partial [Oligoflexia bacterium]|nr:hypothetical protein [Oligoflexia bacterium]